MYKINLLNFMKIKTLLFFAIIVFSSFAPNRPKKQYFKNAVALSLSRSIVSAYNSLDSNNYKLPNFDAFSLALEGFYNLKENGIIKKDVLTIIDYSLSSKVKRMWIIDLTENKIIMNSLVSHGKKSGEDYANDFSNLNESNKSSLGFFATGEVYQGKHGLSLKLDGLQEGINDNARQRSIVVHGAEYVSEDFIKNHNRLGKSQGCPAVPVELSKKIIQIIKDKSCLFIYHPSLGNTQATKSIS